MLDPIRLLIEDVADEFGIDSKLMFGPVTSRIGSRARDLCWLIAVDVLRAKQNELAPFFGCDPATVCVGWKRAKQLAARDFQVRRIYEIVSAAHRERYRLALIGELEMMNRTIKSFRKRAAVIAKLLGQEAAGDEREPQAAE